MTLTIVLLVLLTFVGAEATCHCVLPESNDTVSTCNTCDSECHPLSYYVNNSSMLQNDTNFLFFPGNYILDEVWRFNKSNHTLVNISLSTACNVTQQLETSALARIQCIGNHSGLYFQTISGLTITGLSFSDCGHRRFYKTEIIASSLLLIRVGNLTVARVEIFNSRGWGLYCYALLGNSTITGSLFRGGHYFKNDSGGNIRFKEEDVEHESKNRKISVTDTVIESGRENPNDKHAYAGGLDIYFITRNSIEMKFHRVIFHNNSGYDGGNVAITYTSLDNSWKSTVSFIECIFSNGLSHRGGALYMETIVKNKTSVESNSGTHNVLEIVGTNFTQNSAKYVGGAIYFQVHESQHLLVVAFFIVKSCKFEENLLTQQTGGQGGVAVHVDNFKLSGAISHHVPQYNITFDDCLFTHNGPSVRNNTTLGCGVLYFAENALTVVEDTTIVDNNCTGIAATQTTISLHGNVKILRNTGYNGGGILLCANAVIFISEEAQLYLEDNHAQRFGGGIYAEFECSQAIPPCFYESETLATSVFLINNNASEAGDEVYGGSIDRCYIDPSSANNTTGRKMFHLLFNITHDGETISEIASDPYLVCFCDEKVFNKSYCDVEKNITVHPGQYVYVPVVVVGQRHGTAPGTVRAQFESNHNHTWISTHQKSHSINARECTNLSFTVHTSNAEIHDARLSLSVDNGDFQTLSPNKYTPTYINFGVKECPYGFNLNLTHGRCQCSKGLLHKLEMLECDIQRESFTRKSGVKWWMGLGKDGNNTSKIIFGLYCPFDFCKNSKIVTLQIVLEQCAEKQCSFDRHGILCGKCFKNKSIIFGSSRCEDCRSFTPLVTVALTLLFAVLGILLIILIGTLNLNVTEGTLNPIIFYVNIVRMNSTLFFGQGVRKSSYFLRGFVAWMNLDLEINMCYYNGMTAIEKIALQFLFPFYLLFLAGLIIFFSRRFTLASRIAGKHSVRLLATIILLSYAKIIRTVIDVVWPSAIFQLNRNNVTHLKTVWKMDGSVDYFHGGHRILFLFAVLVTALTLPYTLSLLFIQCLNKLSHIKVLFWVLKLKPFFDAYIGPYKDKYQFWTGFLLVVRIGVFVAIAGNTTRGPILNLAIVSVTSAVLFLLNQPGVYKSWQLSLIESFTYFNLIVLSMTTAYTYKKHISNNEKSVFLCIGSILLLFCGIITYNIVQLFVRTNFWRELKTSLQEKWASKKKKQVRSLLLQHSLSDSSSTSNSEDEQDSLLANAPPLARYDQLREPLVESN